MKELQIFKNEEFGAVRTLDENGKLLFCGSDVAKALGYARPNDAISAHCRATVKRSTPISGKIQEINFIPEGDVYRLIAHSKLPGAERFEAWVFDEVLPSIRKNGGYIAAQENMADAEIMARAVLLAQKTIEERNTRISCLEAKIEQDKPKVLFADAVSTAKTSILIGELAKLLKQNGVEMGQNRLFDWLRRNGYLVRRKGSDFNTPTQRSMELGLFEIKETVITHSDGHVTTNRTPKVTGKGQQYFVAHFLNTGTV